MKCDQVQKMLPAFLEGVLSKTENALVENHLSSCDACRAAFEEYQYTRQLIGGLEEVEPPPGFAQKVIARVEEEERKRGGILRKLFFPLYLKVPVQAVAVVAVAVLAIQAYRAVEPAKETAPQTAITAAPQPTEDSGKEDRRDEPARPAKMAPAIPEQEARIGEGAAKDDPASPPPASAPPGQTRLRKEETAALSQTPAGPVAARETEKAEGAAAGKKAKMEMKAAAPASSREAASLQRIAPIGLTLQAEDPARAGEKVQSLLREFGGIRIEMTRLGEKQIVTAELDPEKLPLLLDRLKTIGEMPEKPRSSEPAAPLVSIRIEIFKR